ncbi:hypothetical protein K501DRAFT_237412 [Backusella circina FSU 941]|nr:hypothetical protein K501DRAFT_237412 [Backusella circina FSU 941]
MGSSDLNLKKSWHPSTYKNQERVWKEEQKRKEEDRKIDQMKKELAEERQLQELQRMQEDAGTKQKSNKLDWMYASPNANLNSSANNDMEDFLLGKKNVDQLLRAKQKQEVDEATSTDRFQLSNGNANTERDIQAKIREDPLLMIKKRQQMALKAIVDNPMRLKELKKKEKKDKKKKSKDIREKSDRHHSSKRRDRSSERSSSHHSSHHRSDKHSSSSRRRSRSASPRRR